MSPSRFSIRDLLWLTLAIALALGWWVRERDLEAKRVKAADRADRWRRAAGALEYVLKEDGWKMHWDLEQSQVRVKWSGLPGPADDDRIQRKNRDLVFSVDFCDPSAKDQ